MFPVPPQQLLWSIKRSSTPLRYHSMYVRTPLIKRRILYKTTQQIYSGNHYKHEV